MDNLDNKQLFEKQFAESRYISTKYGEIETIVVTPSKLTSSIPILFVPGFREIPELQKESLFELFKKGYKVITVVYKYQLIPIKNSDIIPPTELQKAHTLIAIIKSKKIPKINIVTHSSGAIASVLAAYLEPSLFRTLVLITPAGLTGTNSLWRLGLNFFWSLYKSNTLGVVKNFFRKSKYPAPFTKSLSFAIQEGIAMTHFNIAPYFTILRSKGIKIAIIAAQFDHVFPLEKIKKSVKKYPVDSFIVMNSGHETYVLAEELMEKVDDILEKG